MHQYDQYCYHYSFHYSYHACLCLLMYYQYHYRYHAFWSHASRPRLICEETASPAQPPYVRASVRLPAAFVYCCIISIITVIMLSCQPPTINL